MPEKIRQLQETDLTEVSELYNYRKSVDELKWLFSDPDNSENYNAFVAVNDGNIVGVVGYSENTYLNKNCNFVGSIFMSWKVKDGYKGFAGISLLKKVSDRGEFAIAIAGSQLGQSFYSMFKYKFLDSAPVYYKVIKPLKYLKSLKRSSNLKTFGMVAYLLPSYLKYPKKNNSYNSISFEKYNGLNYFEEVPESLIFIKKMTKNYLDWLLKCPLVNTEAFLVRKGNLPIGMCVFYIKNINGSNFGRIIHIPHLFSDHEIWTTILQYCIKYFKTMNCSVISALVHDPESQMAFQKTGFISIHDHAKPVYLKDKNNLLQNIDMKNWHLQFDEGDKMYRDF